MIENIRILADYREKRSGIPELLQSKVNVKIVNLVAGDYLIDEQVIVERKTNEDFIQSLLSNRLFEQCLKLKRESDFQLFIIEGDPYSTNHNISRQAVKGALLSISAAWQIPVFYTKNTCETAEVLIMTGKQNLQNKILSLRKGYKPKRLKNQQLYFLQGLPLIGPSLALRLLISFGSIEDIMHASSKELAGIRGIGKAKAKGIKGFISCRYK